MPDFLFMLNFALVIKDNIYIYKRGDSGAPIKGKKIMISVVLSAVVVAALVAKAVSLNKHITA